MRNFIKKMIMMIMAVAAFLFATPAMAQKAHKGGKISAATRLVIKDRDGGLSLEAPQELKHKKTTTITPDGQIQETPAFGDGTELPFATPKMVNGLEMVQCWIEISDKDYSQLEALGVKIQTKFKDRVTALVPTVVLEKVAELGNISKVSVAKRLKKNTYVSRILTNVDDVLTYSADAQTAGLLQAFDGTGVVLGIIDGGIDFGHQMFKDSNGNSRIKKKYVFNTSSEQLEEYTGTSAYYNNDTHGTHTSSIAGGSDFTATAYVYTTGNSVQTVNNAKFGGMAPGTDLVLCDLGEELTDANIAACIKLVSDYAEQVGKPCVTNLSLGGHNGPHDGTGAMADICAQCTGPGKIIVFSAGNEGEDNIYHSKNASSSSPAMTVLTSQTRSSYGVDYGAIISYARTPNVELAATYYVVDTRYNQVVWTSDEVNTDWGFVDEDDNIVLYGREFSVNDVGADGTTKLSNYFTAYNNDSENYGNLCCYLDKDTHNNKWYVETYLDFLVPKSNSYKIGVSIYPKTGSCYVDSWPEAYIDFTASSASVGGNGFTAGSNDCSINDFGTFPSVISVGSYVSSSIYRANNGDYYQWTANPTYLDISSFSSYQQEGYGPLGTKMPWITAPGEIVIAGYNSSYTPSDLTDYYYSGNNVLGAMSGTSQAAPCVAGITALWLQADPTMTPDQVKAIMASTAIKDSYVTGTNSFMFGNGKIDALAGIEQILKGSSITAEPTALTINAKPNETKTATVDVTGFKLTGNITATLSGPTGLFSISPATLTKNGGTITVTYAPTDEGNHTATITLSSAGADDVTVTINGVCEDVKEYVYVLTSTLTAGKEYLIVNSNNAGSGYALGHNGTSVAANGVTIKSNTDVADGYYIEESDVDAASKWTVGTGWTFKNGDYYVGISGNKNNRYLAIGTSPNYYNWTWDNNLNRLHIKTNKGSYYIRYSSNIFSVNTSQSNIYLYQKVEKKKAAKISVTPTELTFDTAVGETVAKTFNVKGTNLKGAISATFTTNQGNVYSLDASSITVTEAQSGTGKDITVTFSPNEASEYDGTITLTSDGAPSVEVALKGYSTGYSVVVNQFGVATLYVDIPLAIPYETYDGKLTGVFVATDVENNEVRLQRLPKGITANTGVMVTGEPGTYYFPKYRGDDLRGPAKNLLYGSTTDISRNDALTQNNKPNGIVMTLGRNANNIIGFYRYTGSTIRANSAFIIYEPTAGSNVTYLSLDGESGEETDGIFDAMAVKADGAWYTLQGARLSGQPTQRGIYIHGGKKVAVK